LGQELIQSRGDLPSFAAQAFDKIAKLLDWNGDYFERMQDYRGPAYPEGRI